MKERGAPALLKMCHSCFCLGKLTEHRPLIEGVEGRNTKRLCRCTECGNVRWKRPIWK